MVRRPIRNRRRHSNPPQTCRWMSPAHPTRHAMLLRALWPCCGSRRPSECPGPSWLAMVMTLWRCTHDGPWQLLFASANVCWLTSIQAQGNPIRQSDQHTPSKDNNNQFDNQNIIHETTISLVKRSINKTRSLNAITQGHCCDDPAALNSLEWVGGSRSSS